jgi:hypothetical protein
VGFVAVAAGRSDRQSTLVDAAAQGDRELCIGLALD